MQQIKEFFPIFIMSKQENNDQGDTLIDNAIEIYFIDYKGTSIDQAMLTAVLNGHEV